MFCVLFIQECCIKTLTDFLLIFYFISQSHTHCLVAVWQPLIKLLTYLLTYVYIVIWAELPEIKLMMMMMMMIVNQSTPELMWNPSVYCCVSPS